ncbi:hypothetical protein M3G91_32255, partial [Micromonospora chalcea]|uniref:hypothetical protein n=1 Tax=Micromonospora chalcea TaxID=1874 RepID=UPI0021A8B7C7
MGSTKILVRKGPMGAISYQDLKAFDAPRPRQPAEQSVIKEFADGIRVRGDTNSLINEETGE